MRWTPFRCRFLCEAGQRVDWGALEETPFDVCSVEVQSIALLQIGLANGGGRASDRPLPEEFSS